MVLVLFRAGTTSLRSDLGTYFVLEPDYVKHFARYLAYNITILQTIDILVSSDIWEICYM